MPMINSWARAKTFTAEITQIGEEHDHILFHARESLRVLATAAHGFGGEARDIGKKGQLFA